MGMVFAINPTAQKSFAAFQAMAMASGSTVSAASVATTTTASVMYMAATATAAAVATQVSGTPLDGGCSCLCGSMAFPNPAWGIGNFGGLTGVSS
jgi:hypothetical protein